MTSVHRGAPFVPRVAYVLKRFPRLSETFILNELLELERQGVDVEIFSLLRPPAEERHALLDTLRAQVTYLPGRSALAGVKLLRGGAADEPAKTSLEEDICNGDTPLAELFPGKEPAEAAHLTLQASVLASLASARGIRHLHAHFGSNATTVSLLASRLSGIPYSFTAHARDIYHTYVDTQTDDDLRRRKMAEAAFVITVSEYNRRHLGTLGGPAVARKVHRLYNGIDLDRFRPRPAVRAGTTFLAVGRLIEKKGFPDLIDACRILSERGHHFRCVIVGQGPDEDALRARIAAFHLESTVEMVGAQPQERVIELMAQASAVVLPCVVSDSGDRDGLPTVLLEALASGVPAISTTVAGIPEIIDDEECGLLVPPAIPVLLANAMQRLHTDAALRDRLADAARAKAERVFDLRANVEELRRRFVAAIARRPAGHREVSDESRVRIG